MSTQYAQADLEKMTEILSRLLSQDGIAPDEDIYQAGLTSIMVLPLLAEMEEAFQLAIPDADFLDARTPRTLAQLVYRLQNNSA